MRGSLLDPARCPSAAEAGLAGRTEEENRSFHFCVEVQKMKRLSVFLLLSCLLLPLLASCGVEPEELQLVPLDPAATPVLSQSEQSVQIRTPFGPATAAELPSPPSTEPLPSPSSEAPGQTDAQYILNTSSRRFHLPTCSSVSEMKESNREVFFGSRDTLLARGYSPCGRCNP